MDNKCQYEEYHESYIKVDGGNTDKLKGISTPSCGVSRLLKTQESFKAIREAKNGVLEDKTQDNTTRKSSLHRLATSVSFNDKILNRQSKKLSTIFRLSFKRRSSCDVDESYEHGKCF